MTTLARPQARPSPANDRERYERALAGVEAPFALVDMEALWANGEDMLRRAHGKPIRIATKSLRCRSLIEQILVRDPGFRGLLAYTLPEALWLAANGFDDIVVGYPSTDRTAIAALADLTAEWPDRAPVLMVDCIDHLEQLAVRRQGGGRVSGGTTEPEIRLCLELDVGYWTAGGRLKIGPKRSPIRTPEQAVALAREIERRPGMRLVGLMAYEGHIAGVGDQPPGKRLQGAVIAALQRRSAREIRERRAAVVAAVSEIAELEFVNGGGTGSLETTASEEAVTEVAAGSGFYAPTLFDAYSAFKLRPAAMFALPVVRKPSPRIATVLGGGYVASGAAEPSRLPTPHLPPGLRLDRFEGAGEVQTPLLGEPAGKLAIGDRVYFRHAKAGEVCERFNTLQLVEADRVVDEVPTYRGEGSCFL